MTGWEHYIEFCIVLVFENYFYGKKIGLPFNLFHVFKAIGFPDKVSLKAQSRYATCESCFFFYIFIFYI